MQRGDLDHLLAFLAVGQERSFTRAAAKLGVSQSALCHTIRDLEERLGIRLLTRTTRSVSPTEAGERLLHTIGLRFEEIEAGLEAFSELREKPAGTIRITATDYAVDTILWLILKKLLRQYPQIKVEIIIDCGLTDTGCVRFRQLKIALHDEKSSWGRPVSNSSANPLPDANTAQRFRCRSPGLI
jgi:DNA-binding transcriptional LysR family regulator